jgi:hypothetical protein
VLCGLVKMGAGISNTVARQGNDLQANRMDVEIVLTLVAAGVILLLDTVTPLGLAIWFLQVALVWGATLWSARRLQIIIVASVCATFIPLDLWLSPHIRPITWINVTNQLLGIGAIVGLAHSCLNRIAAEDAHRKAAQELKQSQETIRTLSGLLPICAWCKKIRDENGVWEPLEVYIHNHSDAEFTHGMCKECSDRMKLEEKIR